MPMRGRLDAPSRSNRCRRRHARVAAAPSPVLFPRDVSPPSRAEIEAMVEGLIAYLDAKDGDADFEAEEAEASAREWSGQGVHRYNMGAEA